MKVTERVKRLFIHFASLYREAWTSALPDGKARELIESQWGLMMEKLSENQIESALQKILHAKTEFNQFPPNPMQFYEIATADEKPYFGPTHQKQLICSAQKTLKTLYHMSRLRQVLNMKPVSREYVIEFCSLNHLFIPEDVLEFFVSGNLEPVAKFLGV